MINVNDIKIGMTLKIDNNLFVVMDFQHVKPGKGSAFVRAKLKNLRTGTTIEDTYNTNVKFETAHIEKQTMQFLYSQGDDYCFMIVAKPLNMDAIFEIQKNLYQFYNMKSML